MFGEKLRELRLENGYTQKYVAAFLDCNQSMITRWEKEECEPTESIIRKTALLFNVSADYLLGIEDESGRRNSIVNSFNSNSGNINFKG